MKNILLLTIVLCLGCTPIISKIDVSPGYSHTPYTGSVSVLDSAPDNYDEIGWVTVNAIRDSSWGEMLNEAKIKAASQGANAIIFTPENAKVGGMHAWKSLFCKAILTYDSK